MRTDRLLLIALFCLFVGPSVRAEDSPPLRALLVCGGCCHDYVKQKKILAEGVSARANVVWTVYQESKSKGHKNSAYTADDWAKGYDVVLHNECYGGVGDDDFVAKITDAHKQGLGGVNLHCSMHSYRAAKKKEWHQYLGVGYYGHGPKSGIKVELKKTDHPILKGLKNWETKEGELYNIRDLHEGTEVLAEGTRINKPATMPLMWTNTYGKGKVFSMTLGHHNSTMEMPQYLDVVARGVLFVAGKLDENGQPKKGYGPVKRDNYITEKSAK
ncbi:MAG: ThuA domain-containing protein [Phycisphaerae bacterium]|nr:ThuA domain-containing protein [Phycisphaerae bacterium]